MTVYDAIIVGLGGAGSASAYHLSSSGARTLGLEQYGPTHPHGSSHGRTRIYRTAYFEGPAYVPLVQRAQYLWRRLEETSRERILQKTGGLVIGPQDAPAVAGAQRTALACHLEHDLLTADKVRERFPQFVVPENEVALWDPNAGVLFAENCVRCHASGAVETGAELHYGEAVKSWSATSDRVEVQTNAGSYHARFAVLSAGAWTSHLAADLTLPLEVERQFMFWFPASEPEIVRPERMPVFIWDKGPELRTYGIPDFGDGVKVGSWEGKVAASPESADRTFHEDDAVPVREFVRRSFRGLVAQERDYVSCLYTNAPDRNFLIGRHPRFRNVLVISACSGHGFKFTSVVGEIVAQLAHGEETRYDLSLFDPGRFQRPRSSD